MLRKTIMFTKHSSSGYDHARCRRSTTSRTKSFHRNANADIVDNAAKCKHGYAHTCVCRGECDACARCTGYAHGGMTKK
ncbi:hypothetical protein DXA37_05020 [Bifidobacterium pseudocatenulatum]|uniref:Uncharacterized protein n=2 Tax=Bifidobacterium pseudocatenulatum TaxID=28026 RepID=A0A3E5AYN1_BIFPS|nr:hypothetical protein CWS99_07205 [Bifidobacterium pseudocatenulatum]NEY12949.1 hypothetical protein [Bifidobacterium pseudocatenulatum]RGI73359.1 hypothetical protein DXD87_07150 [Bifidobacterium pseudocatenulatum]RGJ11329.1 hypothetical protein DXD75_05830 [Bifidobacterium pseudocatenulatum]RGJ15998.1 hypothetical protein DXD71_07080 [Bifidobacterium pseudocatenulatum]